MRFENRELFLSFWDDERGVGVYALLVAWNDELLPVAAYSFGLHTVTGRYNVHISRDEAMWDAADWREP